MPFKRDNEVFGWRQLTTSADKVAKTVSVLYGDDAAVAYARSHGDAGYPVGAGLALVTWNSEEDPNWFGARIPATVRSVERMTVKDEPLAARLAQRAATLP